MDTESTDSEPADEDLLRRLSSDQVAFEVFYRRHVDRVIGFATRRVTDPADAADLVAATFVTVLDAARSYDPGRGEPGAWLLGITARLIVNARRRKVRESAALARIAGRRLIDQSDIERLEERIDAARSSRAMIAALERLRPRAREALLLVGAAGLQPAGPAVRPRTAGRRRTAAALIGGVAAAGVAAASIAAAGAARPGGHAMAPVAQAPASPRLQTAAYVVDHMTSALNANTAVVNIIDHAPDSQTGKPVIDETWSSSLSDTYRIVDLTPAGQAITGYLVTVKPHRTVSIVINYGNRTWSKTTYPFGSASSARRPGPQRVTPTSDQAIRDDYRWLPATQANLRLITPAGAIPAGFTQTGPSQGR